MIVLGMIIAMALTYIVMLILGAVFVGVAWLALEISEAVYWRRAKKSYKDNIK